MCWAGLCITARVCLRCHGMDAAEYTRLFDIVVQSIRANVPKDVAAEMQFMGLALARHNEWDWYSTFLNHS